MRPPIPKQVPQHSRRKRYHARQIERGILEWGIKERPPNYARFPYRDAPDEEGKEEGI
jgi:hypothetical protein